MNEKLALSVTELSRQIGVSRPMIYREIHSGKLHVMKLGRRTVIPVAAVNAWLEAQTQKEASRIC